GLAPSCVTTGEHVAKDLPGRTLFHGCSFRGYSAAAVLITGVGTQVVGDMIDLVDCTYDADELWLASGVADASVIRMKDSVHGDLAVRRFDQAGTAKPEWNARVTPIESFAARPAVDRLPDADRANGPYVFTCDR